MVLRAADHAERTLALGELRLFLGVEVDVALEFLWSHTFRRLQLRLPHINLHMLRLRLPLLWPLRLPLLRHIRPLRIRLENAHVRLLLRKMELLIPVKAENVIRLLVERLAEQPTEVLVVRFLLEIEGEQVVKVLVEGEWESLAERLDARLDFQLRDLVNLLLDVLGGNLHLPREAALR